MRSRPVLQTALLLGLSGVVACAGPKTTQTREALPFIEDDYPRALQEAKAQKLPIFADVWTPW